MEVSLFVWLILAALLLLRLLGVVWRFLSHLLNGDVGGGTKDKGQICCAKAVSVCICA